MMRNRVVVGGVQIVMGTLGRTRKMLRYLYVFVTVTLPLALLIGCSKQESVLDTTTPAESTLTQSITTSTPIEKALDELRVRFPKDIVIGFEELFDPRPDREPQVDLGPPGLSLDQVLNHVRSVDPKYHVRTVAREASSCVSGKRKCGSRWFARCPVTSILRAAGLVSPSSHRKH